MAVVWVDESTYSVTCAYVASSSHLPFLAACFAGCGWSLGERDGENGKCLLTYTCGRRMAFSSPRTGCGRIWYRASRALVNILLTWGKLIIRTVNIMMTGLKIWDWMSGWVVGRRFGRKKHFGLFIYVIHWIGL